MGAPTGIYKRAKKSAISAPVVRTASGVRSAPLASRGFYGANDRLKRALQGIEEKKVVDTAAASYAVDTTGSVTAINLCAQGTDFTNRIGRKTTNTAIQVTGMVGPNSTADNATGIHGKVLVIYDAQPNSAGAVPSMTDLFTASTSDSFMNLNNRDRFRVLATEDFALGPFDNTATVSLADNSIRLVNIYKRINMDSIWSGTTAAIGSVSSGTILLVTIGNNGSSTGYTARLACRVRFVDA